MFLRCARYLCSGKMIVTKITDTKKKSGYVAVAVVDIVACIWLIFGITTRRGSGKNALSLFVYRS